MSAHDTPATARTAAKAHSKEEASSRIVMLTIAAGVVSAAAGQWWLSPLLGVAPLVHLLATGGSRLSAERLDGLTVRWAGTLMLTVLIATAFLPGQTRSAVPGGPALDEHVRDWLAGDGAPAWGVVWMAVVAVVVAAVTVVSDGVGGWLLYTVLILQLAINGSAVYEHGDNLVTCTLVALSPWQWALIAGLTLAIGPLRERSFVHFLAAAPAADAEKTRRRLLIAGALIVLALLLRLVLAAPYTRLAMHWTVT